jgi:hypothetical protein
MRVLKELCSSVKVILTDEGYRRAIIETIKKGNGQNHLHKIINAIWVNKLNNKNINN